MEGIQTDNVPAMIAGDVAATHNKSMITVMMSFKLTVTQLLQKLENLLFLKSTEFFCE